MDRKIREIFYLIKEGKYEEKDIKLIFNYCLKIGEASAGANPRVTESNLKKWNITVKELIFESAAPLFTKNSRNILNLRQSIINWKSDIVDDSDIDFFLHRVVWKSVEQRIMNFIKESDPFFNKILKTVSIGITRNHYKKFNYFGVVYVIPVSHNEIDGPVITDEEFSEIPINFFIKKQKKLLDGLMRYLTENTPYFPAIPLNALIKKIKDLYLGGNTQRVNSNESGLFEIKDLINQSKENVIAKLKTTYLRKNKLNNNDIEKIIRIFNSISNDLIDGGLNSNMIAYFEEFFPDESKEIYYNKYQKILNYLYKNFKAEIISKLL